VEDETKQFDLSMLSNDLLAQSQMQTFVNSQFIVVSRAARLLATETTTTLILDQLKFP